MAATDGTFHRAFRQRLGAVRRQRADRAQRSSDAELWNTAALVSQWPTAYCRSWTAEGHAAAGYCEWRYAPHPFGVHNVLRPAIGCGSHRDGRVLVEPCGCSATGPSGRNTGNSGRLQRSASWSGPGGRARYGPAHLRTGSGGPTWTARRGRGSPREVRGSDVGRGPALDTGAVRGTRPCDRAQKVAHCSYQSLGRSEGGTPHGPLPLTVPEPCATSGAPAETGAALEAQLGKGRRRCGAPV